MSRGPGVIAAAAHAMVEDGNMRACYFSQKVGRAEIYFRLFASLPVVLEQERISPPYHE